MVAGRSPGSRRPGELADHGQLDHAGRAGPGCAGTPAPPGTSSARAEGVMSSTATALARCPGRRAKFTTCGWPGRSGHAHGESARRGGRRRLRRHGRDRKNTSCTTRTGQAGPRPLPGRGPALADRSTASQRGPPRPPPTVTTSPAERSRPPRPWAPTDGDVLVRTEGRASTWVAAESTGDAGGCGLRFACGPRDQPRPPSCRSSGAEATERVELGTGIAVASPGSPHDPRQQRLRPPGVSGGACWASARRSRPTSPSGFEFSWSHPGPACEFIPAMGDLDRLGDRRQAGLPRRLLPAHTPMTPFVPLNSAPHGQPKRVPRRWASP